MKQVVIFLGVPDPELEEIENVLEQVRGTFDCGDGVFRRRAIAGGPFVVSIRHAMVDGRRVHPGNAYKADKIADLVAGDTLVCIECAPSSIPEGVKVVVVDHHRPGDPGYDMGASQYWEASSLGQVCHALETGAWGFGIPDPEGPHVGWGRHWLCRPGVGGRWHKIAALDHCRSAALAGRCPGVSAEAALATRVAEIAKATLVTEEEVRERIESFREEITASEEVVIGGQVVRDLRRFDLGVGYSPDLLAAQTAGSLDGYAVLFQHRDTEGGKIKCSLSEHPAPETIIAFKESWAPSHGLVRVYGVPDRGYAGGYLE